MQFTVKKSYLLAFAIIVGIVVWMWDGEIETGGWSSLEPSSVAVNSTDDDRTEAANSVSGTPFKVRTVTIGTVQRTRSVPVRGRTKADAIVPIRAETSGIIEKRLVSRGDMVRSGDLVCVIQQGARKASLASAVARYEQMKAEYAANQKLQKKGFVSKSVMRQKRFELDVAKAQWEQANIELKRTEVRANATGIVQDPIAEVGDVLKVGGTCVTLVDSDPVFFTGRISEREVDVVRVGMPASVELVTGGQMNGTVSYIAPSADSQTRTFLMDIELEKTDHMIRDGLTATAAVNLPPVPSIRVRSSWLSIDDNGMIGIKVVDANSLVQFKPVRILSRTNEGFWISGLTPGDEVITFGQEYVKSGESVEAIPELLEQAEVM